MPTYIAVDSTVTITVVFRNWNSDEDYGDIVIPDSVDVSIYRNDATALYLSGPATAQSDGSFTYTWTPSEIGEYTIDFVGTFNVDNSTTVITEDFTVATESLYTERLDDEQELVFAVDATPLYIDPETLLTYFSEATALEVMELVHKYSLEVQKIFKDKELPAVAYEYIEAATLCSLARVYDEALGGQETSFTLGQLQVTDRRNSRGPLTRGSASNWCELAAALRIEMRRTSSGSVKGVVRGSKLRNPMPQRHLKDVYGTGGHSHL